MEQLRVAEMFDSLQGEGTRAGLPCAFVRLAGCNLRCRYCDTAYAQQGPGEAATVEEAAARLEEFGRRLVCITGGEPLLQPACVPLARRLIDLGHTVVVETNGTTDIRPLPAEAVRIMDVKCPGSGECGKTLPLNLRAVRPCDEVKFVLCGRADFEWAVDFLKQHGLPGRCHLLMAPAHGLLEGQELAEWILGCGLELRLQLQLHKILWPQRTRGA